MGLFYTAFRTGGRGFQAIIPLPCALTPTAASFLSRGLRLALRGRKGLTGVHVDRDSFDGLMRLPGGVHARGNTGLFIDMDRGELFPLATQLEMIGSCLKPKKHSSSISEGELLDAEQQLLAEPSALIYNEDEVLPIVRKLTRNPICEMLARAFIAADADFTVAKRHRPSSRRDLSNMGSLAHCDRASAQAVWDIDVQPGGWWEWIHMGGDGGQLAAVILFGAKHAEDRLLDKARSHPAASRTDERERIATTKGLWKSFELKAFVPTGRRIFVMKLGEPRHDIETLAKELVAKAKASSPSSARWSEARVSAVLTVVMQAIAESEGDSARLSLRDIQWLLEEQYPALTTSLPAINNCLSVVCRVETGPDPSTVLGGSNDLPTANSDPIVEALIRYDSSWQQSTYMPGSATWDWMEKRGLLGKP